MEGEQLENAINDGIDTNEDNANSATGNGNNTKKKKRSDVWPHFSTTFVLEENIQIEYAHCNYCPA